MLSSVLQDASCCARARSAQKRCARACAHSRVTARGLSLTSLTMRTRAQRRAAQGLHRLGDDPLQKVLSYLSFGECARGPGSVSKSLLAMAASTSLKRARGLESYTLGGDKNGIVHALATSCGTKLWPTRLVRRFEFQPPCETVALPPGVTYIISRVKDDVASIDDETYGPGHPPLKQKCHGLFDGDLSEEADAMLTTSADCMLDSGSVFIKLPLQLRASQFRIGFGNCRSCFFRNWVFEAYSENENVWHTLYDSGGVIPWKQPGTGKLTVFPVDCSFGASQFRIRLDHGEGQCQCMHIRGLELFGTILPPWRID